jgi:hypothetical protein
MFGRHVLWTNFSLGGDRTKPCDAHVFISLGVDLQPSKGTLSFRIEKEANELNCEFSQNFYTPKPLKNYGDPVRS